MLSRTWHMEELKLNISLLKCSLVMEILTDFKEQTSLIKKLEANRSNLLNRFQVSSNNEKWKKALLFLASLRTTNQ